MGDFCNQKSPRLPTSSESGFCRSALFAARRIKSVCTKHSVLGDHKA
jgi:hypothetical protein